MRLRPVTKKRPEVNGRLARVGITGGVAEGKSTVLRYLREAGYRVASADDAARRILDIPDVRQAVARAASLDVSFARAELMERLSSRPESRRAVNRVLHPYIVDALAETGAEFIEVPLLVETGLQDRFEEVWVVTCGVEEQVRRLVERVGDKAAAQQILALQLPTTAKVPFADVILRTNEPRRRVKAYTLRAASGSNNSGVARRVK